MDSGFSARRRNHIFVSHRRDVWLEWCKSVMSPNFELGKMDKIGEQLGDIENMIEEYRKLEKGSRLQLLVPGLSRCFFTPLPLQSAFELYNKRYQITKRRFIPVSFNELRHIMNLAQVMAFGQDPKKLELITLDGDQTLYKDQKNFEDLFIARRLLSLLEQKCKVAVVTAAAYAEDAEKYEVRLQVFFDYLRANAAPEDVCNNFWVLGGECAFLFQLQGNYKLKYMPPDTAVVTEPNPEHLKMLDISEQVMKDCIKDLRMNARVIRKIISCGLVSLNGEPLRRENLDECCLRIQHEVVKNDVKFEFVAFNGGNDVWFDIGNKAVGIERLQSKFTIEGKNCLHIGDQLLTTGNDHAAMACSPVAWITSPVETKKILSLILKKVFDVHCPEKFSPVDECALEAFSGKIVETVHGENRFQSSEIMSECKSI